MSLDRLMAICQQKGWGLEVSCVDYRHYVAIVNNGQKILTRR